VQRALKIQSLTELLSLRDTARNNGKTVVHCHGCFDIVHPGHIHHLQFARSLGDLLVVSISADSQVNKGPSRPLIPDDLRAESLAALECVDAVYLNPDPTAVELLNALRPDIYVKGREYEQSKDPRFVQERQAVVDNGGRMVFSSGDIVYSSTALIGSLQQRDTFRDQKLQRFCSGHRLNSDSLAELVHRFRGMPVLVVGDYILDRYHYCEASGVAGESPMMALKNIETVDYDGGAGVVALHLAGLGAAPVLVTALSDDDASTQTEMRLRGAGIETHVFRHRRQLATKHRYLVDETKLMKVDEGSATPLDSIVEETIAGRIIELSNRMAAVVFADFGHGLITAGLLDRIMQPLRDRVQFITADVSGRQSNLLRFKNVDLLCPTEREAREALGDFGSGLGAVVSQLLRATAARQAIITLGKQGLMTFDWPAGTALASGGRLRSEYLPALSNRTIDSLGCGDALLASASLALAAGGSLAAAGYLGSIAAAVQVQRLGNRPISVADIFAALPDVPATRSTARLAS
jgi:rfaE bifunctional protein kinase chain/domain/rfaE bifunctional protein nucleotidyltransferase chain/domain